MKERSLVLSLLLLLSLTSCRLFQHRSQEGQEVASSFNQYRQQRNLLYNTQWDSLSRYWYFWTDSSFRFHPDSGLYGKAGTLLLQESSVNSQGQQRQSVTTAEAVAQTKASRKKEADSTWGLGKWGLILLVLAVVYVLWKSRLLSR